MMTVMRIEGDFDSGGVEVAISVKLGNDIAFSTEPCYNMYNKVDLIGRETYGPIW